MGFFDKLKDGLKKTKSALVQQVSSIFSGLTGFDDDFFEELEETLILADVGVNLSVEIIDQLRDRIKQEKIKDGDIAKQALFEILENKLDSDISPLRLGTQPSVILVIGVNGVGKTTSIAKIASYLKSEGKTPILAAADTFRAAAIDQLDVWSKRVGVEMVRQSEGSDPAAVVYDAIAVAKKRRADVLIVDTAGRLHNKKNLMDELAKIDRVISRELPNAERETLLVLDATTGQNAVNQAKEFKNSADITGLVLTKLDGTAKGGIVFSVKEELGIPVKFIGVGEGQDDLRPFVPADFVKALFED